MNDGRYIRVDKAVVYEKRLLFFKGAFMLLLNRIFAPSPPKGRKRRGGSANVETVFARSRRENIARGRRKTVAESSPARDVSSGQGAAAFFRIKKAPFFKGAFLLVSIALLFHPYPKGGNTVGAARMPRRFSPERGARTSPADAGRQSPRAARREMFRQGKARRRSSK